MPNTFSSSPLTEEQSPLYDELAEEGDLDFIDLDQEISQYEANMLKPRRPPSRTTCSPKTQPIMKRIVSSIRNRLVVERQTFSSSDSIPLEVATITCRLCENSYLACDLDAHTEWCSQYQDCVMKKSSCAKYLDALARSLAESIDLAKTHEFQGDLAKAHKLRGDLAKVHEFVLKALEIDEQAGKHSAIRLAKLQYRITKIDFGKEQQLCPDLQTSLKRAKYLIEQKKMLADRFTDLLPNTELLSSSSFSSVTDSSLDSTPKRPSTPVGKLTNLLSQMLKGSRSNSRSPQFGTSPPRPSNLRGYVHGPIPQIADFEIIKPISRGAYGNVYLAKKKATDDLFAIKVLKKSDLIRKNMTSNVVTERRVLSLAQVPFVVMLYYAFESRDHLFLVMEYLIGGDLSSVLQERGRLTEDEARFYMAELLLALEYLHDHGIIHRDLKPDNMLLDADGHLKLTDFGLAGYGNKTTNSRNRVLGTPDYLAPELIREGNEPHGTAVDWWSVGVCLFELLVGIPPFSGQTLEEIFSHILAFERINWDDFAESGLSEEAKDLVDGLLRTDPDTRLGSSGARAHPFFTTIHWESLRTSTAPIQPRLNDSLDTSNFDARNKRYENLGLPPDFMEAEPVNDDDGGIIHDSSSGISTPLSLSRRTSSPFDGFVYKNIDLLSRVNRKLSSTSIPTGGRPPSQASSGTLSDNSLGIS